MTPIRVLEKESIERFLLTNVDKLGGRVLDIGCGQQPYAHIVTSSGGTYVGYDRKGLAGSVVTEDIGPEWDAVEPVDVVIMTQVWQYIPLTYLMAMLEKLSSGSSSLKQNGWLLATGPTNWPLVEKEDLHRFTAVGAEHFLQRTGFRNVRVEERAAIDVQGEHWPLGWKAIARAS